MEMESNGRKFVVYIIDQITNEINIKQKEML